MLRLDLSIIINFLRVKLPLHSSTTLPYAFHFFFLKRLKILSWFVNWQFLTVVYVTIRHLLISHLICPPKFRISIVFNFSWNGCNTQEKWKTKLMQNFGGQIKCAMADVQVAYIWYLTCTLQIKLRASWINPRGTYSNICFTRGSSAPSSNPLPFNIPFLKEKVTLLYLPLTKGTPFKYLV